MSVVTTNVNRILERIGYQLRRNVEDSAFDSATLQTIKAVSDYTMTSAARIATFCDAVRYVHRNGIEGAIVECGVWAGGSMMAAARTLIDVDETDRELYLFDTFSGMSSPTDADRDLHGRSAADLLASDADKRSNLVWAYKSLEEVRHNLTSTGYPQDRCHYADGMVEKTVPDEAPDAIAVLRLDTDWYESTRHELEHLVSRIAPYGVLIIDDYGHWDGARKAVDEWLDSYRSPVFLSRIDYTGRVAVIPGDVPR